MKSIPYEKLSKKARRQLDAAKRRSWGALSPVTRKSRNKKYDDRKKVRKDDFFDGPFFDPSGVPIAAAFSCLKPTPR